jgi:hypothetical protein
MATSGEYITIPGLVASTTFASKQFYAAKFASTANQVIPVTGITDACIGVVQNDPAVGEAAEVAALGVAKAAVEASVSAGNHLGLSTTGRLRATSADNTAEIAIALEGASTSAGDIIKVLLKGLGRY